MANNFTLEFEHFAVDWYGLNHNGPLMPWHRERLAAAAERGECRGGHIGKAIDALPLPDGHRALLRANIKPPTARQRALIYGWVRGQKWARPDGLPFEDDAPFREHFLVALDELEAKGFITVRRGKKGPGIYLNYERIRAAVAA